MRCCSPVRDDFVAPHDARVYIVLLNLAAAETLIYARSVKEAGVSNGGSGERHREGVCHQKRGRDVDGRVFGVSGCVEAKVAADDAREVIRCAKAVEAATR